MFKKFVLAVLAAASLVCPAIAEDQKSISIFIAYTGTKYFSLSCGGRTVHSTTSPVFSEYFLIC